MGEPSDAATDTVYEFGEMAHRAMKERDEALRAPAQGTFEGMEVGEYRVSLKSASNHPTDRFLGYKNHVKGTFVGVVDAVEFVTGPDGHLRRIQKITALDIDITEATPAGYEEGED